MSLFDGVRARARESVYVCVCQCLVCVCVCVCMGVFVCMCARTDVCVTAYECSRLAGFHFLQISTWIHFLLRNSVFVTSPLVIESYMRSCSNLGLMFQGFMFRLSLYPSGNILDQLSVCQQCSDPGQRITGGNVCVCGGQKR